MRSSFLLSCKAEFNALMQKHSLASVPYTVSKKCTIVYMVLSSQSAGFQMIPV